MPQQLGAPPIFSGVTSTTAVPIALTTVALQNTGTGTVAGCNTALITTGAHGYTETLNPNGIKTIANATTHHGTQTVGGSSAYTFTYFMITGATGNTAVNNIVVAAFRVPSTTTLLVALPVAGTNPTVTAANLVPIFIPAGGLYNLALGPNCVVQYNPDNTGLPYQDPARTAVPAPTWNTLMAASTNGQMSFDGAGATIIAASGGAGSSSWSKYFR